MCDGLPERALHRILSHRGRNSSKAGSICPGPLSGFNGLAEMISFSGGTRSWTRSCGFFIILGVVLSCMHQFQSGIFDAGGAHKASSPSGIPRSLPLMFSAVGPLPWAIPWWSLKRPSATSSFKLDAEMKVLTPPGFGIPFFLLGAFTCCSRWGGHALPVLPGSICWDGTYQTNSFLVELGFRGYSALAAAAVAQKSGSPGPVSLLRPA